MSTFRLCKEITLHAPALIEILLGVHSVSYAKLVNDIASLSRTHAELLAYIRHIDLKLFNTALVGIFSPYRLDYRRIGHHLTAVFGKEGKNIILRLRQLDFPLGYKDPTRIVIYH